MQEGWGHHGLVDDWHQGPALFLRPAQGDHPGAGPVAENGRRLAGSYVLCGVRAAANSMFSVCACSGGHHRIIVLRLCFGVMIWILAGRRLFPPKRARGWSEHSGVAWCLVEGALGVPKGAIRKVPRWHTEGPCMQ